jgi:hypothetical protein
MKTLNLQEMEMIEGGISDCGVQALKLGATFLGAFLVTGPVGAGVFAARFIWGSVKLAEACSY